MIDHHTWRSLIYRLAEEYPDCLMLNFTIKLISDAGYQSEITSISTAAQQIEVYSRVLKNSIIKFITNPDDVQKNIEECAVSSSYSHYLYKNALDSFVFVISALHTDEFFLLFLLHLQRMVCHGQHTYVYSQVLVQVLSQEPKGGFNMKRLSQEITKYALQK